MKRRAGGEKVRRGRRILLVDNDPVVLEALGDMLETKEYQVTRARDGLEALERFRESQFDVVIFDLVLRKIDGHDLCRRIRQDERGHLLPLIAITPLAPHDVVKLPGLSADAYVAKGPLGVIIPNILEAIKSVLAKRKGRVKPAIYGYEGFHPRRIVSELFELKQYYQRLVHSLADVVIELDAQGKVLSASLGALQLLGRSEAEITGLPFSHLLAPPDRPALESLVQRVSRDPEEADEVITVALAGKRHRLRWRPVSESGTIVGFLVTAES